MTRNRVRTTLAALVTASALVAVAACGDADSAGAPRGSAGTPATEMSSSIAGPYNEADVMFASGMVPHHAQAIEMSDIVLAKDGVDPAVVELARAIKKAQGPEIELLRGWLAAWGEPVPPADSWSAGARAGHDMGGMGLMTEQDMAALEAAGPRQASRLFLKQMIVHHRGAVAMARTELAAGVNPDAQALAEQIITTQEAEIAEMTRLLRD